MRQRIRLSESQLRNVIAESVKSILNEGIYDYPDGIDHLIFLSENDSECYDILMDIVRMVKKKYDRGVEISSEVLADSSVMKKYQQFAFRKFRHEQPDISRLSPRMFREYVSENIVERIKFGEYSWMDKK